MEKEQMSASWSSNLHRPFGPREPHVPKLDTLEIKTGMAIRGEIRICVLEIERLVQSLC
jgi:hypothetical protein